VKGFFLHPRRHPPARERRSPVLERLTEIPLGWLAERLAAPFFRWDHAAIETPEVSIPVPGLAVQFDGYRIALVTDLHHGPAVPARWLSRVAERVAALAPDLVVLGGDFVSHARSDLQGLDDIIARFRAPDGTLAVLGNHDHWVDPDAVAAAIERGGARLLTNQHVMMRRGTGALAVGGVDDFSHGAVRPDDALAGVPLDIPRVLLSHNPDLIEYLPQELRVDVMLSGHTHNGQAHFPLIGPITAPSQFGRKYLHGLKQVGQTWLYVSAGIGSAWIPRWGNPPELPMIRLLAAPHIRGRIPL
jgi:predicted MPP superfamily phosphohydrolase